MALNTTVPLFNSVRELVVAGKRDFAARRDFQRTFAAYGKSGQRRFLPSEVYPQRKSWIHPVLPNRLHTLPQHCSTIPGVPSVDLAAQRAHNTMLKASVKQRD